MDFLTAKWPAPTRVHALTTTRSGGVSAPPFDENNLALHVGDEEAHVLHNRKKLIDDLALPSTPQWLNQTHGHECVLVEEETSRMADASVTRKPNTVLAIMTADCLPILITNQQGNEIAAIHAGWRGLANGVIESTLKKMHSNTDQLMAWIGPAICQRCYATGSDVQETFLSNYPFSHIAFKSENSLINANLPHIAELILNHHGVNSVSQSRECTYEARVGNGSTPLITTCLGLSKGARDGANSMDSADKSRNVGARKEMGQLLINDTKNRYFSYRQEKQTGRIASLIWFNH